MRKIITGILAFILFYPAVAQTNKKVIDIGGITLNVSNSWTAQVFHIVDQLSDWSPYSHHQYLRWARRNLQLNKEDSAMLHNHATLRRSHSKSEDFDKSFIVDGSIQDAISQSVIAQRLSAKEAEEEQVILLYFSKRLSVLQALSDLQVNSFYKNLAEHDKDIAAFIVKLRQFAQTQGKVTVPVYLVVNPEEGSGGGEANGGRIIIELQQNPDPLPVLIHESLHFLLTPYKEKIKAESDSAKVDWQVINEGIAYAMEGLTEDADLLPVSLVRNIAAGRLLSDRYTEFYMAAIIFRPILREALEKGETITTFLPKAISSWQQMNVH